MDPGGPVTRRTFGGSMSVLKTLSSPSTEFRKTTSPTEPGGRARIATPLTVSLPLSTGGRKRGAGDGRGAKGRPRLRLRDRRRRATVRGVQDGPLPVRRRGRGNPGDALARGGREVDRRHPRVDRGGQQTRPRPLRQ